MLESNLQAIERSRDQHWLRYSSTSGFKLRWRALSVRNCLHILPGESILEFGAGRGMMTQQLVSVLRGQNRITAAVFDRSLYGEAHRKNLPNVEWVLVEDLARNLPESSFDYVVGSGILFQEHFAESLRSIRRLLKPGGQFLFIEPNQANPGVLLRALAARFFSGRRFYPRRISPWRMMHACSQQGFTHVELLPYDMLHRLTPASLVPWLESKVIILEHAPVIRLFCGSLLLWAQKPGAEAAPRSYPSLADYPELFGAISVVVPCHNEGMNLRHLVDALVGMYGHYLHEVIIVNDNSTDDTAEVASLLAQKDSRIKVINRTPPNGVGRALSDGYRVASGRYILSMDCDFVQIIPEFRELFDAVAGGYDGAIGSRFSHESILMNYPFFKVLCNRLFHTLVNILLVRDIRDVSNNLKLYKADILKNLQLEEPHFAANVETGLKPILAGYKIKEVPMSWINRTAQMGSSSFRIVRVGPGYFRALLRILWNSIRGASGSCQPIISE
jgi:ubiquinone/menaquinone biosynthesis C-methylase UbiE